MARRRKTKYDKYFSSQTRSSITGFSKNAAGGTKRRKSYTERKRNRTVGIVVACVLGAVLIFTASFFITDTLMGISDAEVETTNAPSTDAAPQGGSTAPQNQPTTEPVSSEIKAKIGDSSLLANSSSLDAYINSLKNSGLNAVVIDFKDENGYLNYPSSIAAVQNTNIVSRSQANAAQAVKKLQASGIAVIARIYCFKDVIMPRADRTAAVHYSGTDSLWHDNDPAKGGKPWLNPYSAAATGYLTAVVKEVKNLGVNYIMLDGVQFPNLNSGLATFDGEKTQGAPSRNAVLINFVNSCVSAAQGTPVICTMKGDAVVSGSSHIYDGALWNANASVFAVDTTSLADNANKNYPSSKKVIEIKKAAQSGEREYILVG